MNNIFKILIATKIALKTKYFRWIEILKMMFKKTICFGRLKKILKTDNDGTPCLMKK